MQKAPTASRAFTPRSSPRWATSVAAVGAVLTLIACGQGGGEPAAPAKAPAATGKSSPESIPMGGAKSVMTFFITSKGPGKGGDLGGLAGADAYCQSLAEAEKAGDHTWRAYLSTAAADGRPAVNARDRIGKGPWYNAEGFRIAVNLEQLHGENKIDKENATTERLDPINGVGDNPVRHDILTGSRPDGTAFAGTEDLTCSNWTSSSSSGRAQVGHHDRKGQGESAASWNSAHPSRGCSQTDLESTGGAGLFYCFGID